MEGLQKASKAKATYFSSTPIPKVCTLLTLKLFHIVLNNSFVTHKQRTPPTQSSFIKVLSSKHPSTENLLSLSGATRESFKEGPTRFWVYNYLSPCPKSAKDGRGIITKSLKSLTYFPQQPLCDQIYIKHFQQSLHSKVLSLNPLHTIPLSTCLSLSLLWQRTEEENL